jgi:flagellar FliJ protein
MKPFRFRLNKVLSYRRHLEKMAQQELVKAQMKVGEIEQHIQDLNRLRLETVETCGHETKKGMTGARYQFFQSYLVTLDFHLETAGLDLIKAREMVKEKQAVLQQTAIGKKSLEVLKDKQHDAYMAAFATEEQKHLDEMILLRRR